MEFYEKVIRAEIQELRRVKDTFDDRFDYLRLDKNECLLPFDEKLFSEFKQGIKDEDLSGYPELGPLYQKIADYLGVTVGQLLLGAGSDLAIKSVYEACIHPGDGIILHAPGYAMYHVYANMFGANVKPVPLNDDWSVNQNAMLDLVDDSTKLFVLENPNGFVGTKPSLESIESCSSNLYKYNALLLVDEAYYYIENVKSETHELIKKCPNLIIAQTLSKGHGLAGVRVGYLIGDEKLIDFISRVRPMHEVSSLSSLAAQWILDHPEILLSYQKEIRDSKNYLMEELLKLNVSYRDTHANFILIFLPNEGRTAEVQKKLMKDMILIRRPFEESYLKGWSRVCVGALDDSRRFIKGLRTSLS